ncbi:DUF4279 domain-containing protein [Streptomyces sp. NPDC059766]|uniref:DUF4279 domain-containing protein n=1 Tax=Streptomyces sp. NPDC059766 TaxID=3346940 RepID=UPI003655B1DC
MPLRQYVYFALSSESITAREMTAFLGIEPDETTVRGSRRTAPVAIPVSHRWKIACRDGGLRVDEQISMVTDRLRPHARRIAQLAEQLATHDPSHCPAALQIVRYFNDSDEADPPQLPNSLDHPNLFGWHLDRDVLDFLAATGAVLDVDEYDLTPAAAED